MDGAELPHGAARGGRQRVDAYLSVTDIDERKRRELDLENKAEHDALTGLLNRQSASLRMTDALERTVEHGYRGAFAITDLSTTE